MSRANRRRKKMGGRPRTENVEREANGRISRRKADVEQRTNETEREVRAVVVEARTRHFNASEAESVRPEFGSVLGRLFLAKGITKRQYEAGSRMCEDFGRYYALTGIPHPSAKAQDISRVRGLGSDADPLKARAAANRVMAIETLLGKNDLSGRPITSVTKRICIMDDGQGMEYGHMRLHLISGLNLLADWYGLDKQEAA